MAEGAAPIIVKKKKQSHQGHHGGSWKVAFADFAVAMMAFFLILWLLSQTNELQKKAIADYFTKPGIFKHESSTSPIKMKGSTQVKSGEPAIIRPKLSTTAEGIVAEQADNENSEGETENMQAYMESISSFIDLKQKIAGAKSITVQAVPRGILIEISETEQYPMFALGSAEMTPYYEDLLLELAPVIAIIPNHILVTGHTDASQYKRSSQMNNWYLSAMRAETARRVMVFGGYPQEQVLQLIAMGDNALKYNLIPNDRRNRRIEILILTEKSEKIIRSEVLHKKIRDTHEKLTHDELDSIKNKVRSNQYDGSGMGPGNF